MTTDKKLSSSVKSVIAPSEDSSKSSTSSSSKKKIMERLGEFVGVKGKITDGNRSRASKQVSITDLLIFQKNFIVPLVPIKVTVNIVKML